jgi:iron complex transport system substrate-binding protein
MRIVSLLPSITEVVCALGMEKHLVGRSHECDYPESVSSLPVLTKPKYSTNGKSRDIDKQVKSLLEKGLSVYEVDAQLLAELKPDVILTQDHCEVCAVSLPEVEAAVKSWTGNHDTIVVSVSPTDLNGIYQSIIKIGDALQREAWARKLVEEMKDRLGIIRSTVAGKERKSVVSIEWIDPLMTAGNWIPELVEIAGGDHYHAEPGEHSPWINWNQVRESDPDLIVIMPCGFNFEQIMEELPLLTSKEGWDHLEAVKKSETYLLEGNQYFNRPGPRIVESTRILAEILHPDHFKPTLKETGWKRLADEVESINKI